jgi:hypothetical protein
MAGLPTWWHRDKMPAVADIVSMRGSSQKAAAVTGSAIKICVQTDYQLSWVLQGQQASGSH